MLYSDFKSKEVINIKDCKRLGKVTDFEFDECSGQICKIIVACGCSVFDWFKCESDYTIPYRDIKQVGPYTGGDKGTLQEIRQNDEKMVGIFWDLW